MSSLENLYTGSEAGEAQNFLDNFWAMISDEIRNVTSNDFKTQELPLARIKKIMKLDEDVKMISAEAPVLFAKAAEIFITELTLRAWIHAEDNKRRTLQRNDIAMAVSKYDQFDFLIDIVPRDEVRPTKREDGASRSGMPTEQMQYFLQVPQQTVLTGGATSVIQQPVQLPDIVSPQVSVNVTPVTQTTMTSQQQPQQQQQPQAQQQQAIQVYTQVVGANGEVQQIPIQLTPAQMQAITMQMQGKQPGQSIVVRTTPADQQQQSDTSSASGQNQPVFQLPMYVQQVSGQAPDVEPDDLEDTNVET